MENKEILMRYDHTLLSVNATWEEIKAICDDGIAYGTASVCIPPSFVSRAKKYVQDRLTLCTVIGFPNGYNATSVKVFEAEEAIRHGADEIDMVINVGELKAGNYTYVQGEITAVKKACGDKILKVIIETCLLTEEEKKICCRLVTDAGADYIKTSTGFSKGGATREDVKLLREQVGKNVKVKAAGGIASLQDAEDMISLGADRLGTSRIVKILKNQDNRGY